MNIRILGIVILLSCTVFTVGIDRCDRSEASQTEQEEPKVETVQANDNPSNQAPPPSEREDENEGDDGPAEEDPNSSLSPLEYGRENPFKPLVRGRSAARTTARSKTTPKKTTAKKAKVETVVRLTAILGENSAIFKENGADKSVSTGDTVGGMKVLEIRINEGKVVLGKGDEKLTIALGTQIKL